ncbi:hypothetical protein [Actinomadura decatromicini]|uniref:DUF397 domain-containing protein n=1 Tax=Actinomadura decatromicini TaxID=2604572 RepID=A0A5D3FU23_9ACTN|nr:hypothetical protein [Actinomadura decatromicini]TYK51366.1 hypothetical protein FXF68_13245 [Actinomadura decatromicini]
MNSSLDHLIPVATFCDQCTCGCPRLSVDPASDPSARIVITDDFGHFIQLSTAQLMSIVAQAQDGSLVRDVTAAVQQAE